MTTIKAIETQYKGYRFRSRLEARWAVFFDALGVKWEYEKEGYDLGDAGWYLPDFWLSDMGIWVEIKGQKSSSEERLKAYKLSSILKQGVLMIEGTPGIERNQYERPVSLFNTTLYAGECFDTFDVPCTYVSSFLLWSADHFESLRKMLLLNNGGFLCSDDWKNATIGALDEESRRRIIVDLDRLYFHRKYGKEHQSWRWGRCENVYFSRRKIYKPVERTEYTLVEGYVNEDYPPEILQAINAARSARFEHGETPQINAQPTGKRISIASSLTAALNQGTENPFSNELPSWLRKDNK